jgi:glycosyltransferase involved in cell wall biosynthesis
MTKNNKLKILMCSEASFIHSGFGIYAKELLTRLHKTNKYEIAEFASYGFVNDPRDVSIHWKYYANAVKDSDNRHKEYSSRVDNQFGRWRFEKVLLDFRPDIVIDVRDYWMSAYQGSSPLRKFFHWILMPTVDSSPQQEEWIDTFLDADAVFTYSDWGAEVLKEQSSNKINYIDTTSPGVDINTFKIKDRSDIKQQLGLSSDSIIIGSVMRNQKRKLIPELFTTFREVLDRLEASNSSLGENLYLYLHTSYPDMGWDIPELLRQSRVSNRVLFTYICKNCKTTQCSVFTGPQKVCIKCMSKSMTFPSVTEGVSSDTLSSIYNIFDLYVQYSICEGFGMPQVEAGACGVPIATVDYSAMCDIVKKLKAYPIKIQTLFKELETKALRVYPDNNDLANYIIDFINKPKPTREKLRHEIQDLTHQHYNWDNIAQKWEKYFDELDSKGYRSKWNTGKYETPVAKDSNIDPQSHFDRLIGICNNNFQETELIGSYKMLELLKNADYGFVQASATSMAPFDFNNTLDYINTMIDNNNQAENVKNNNVKFDEDFITYAHLKNVT